MATTYDVKTIQLRLNNLGFRDENGHPLVVDGVFGPRTSQAVIAFKKSVGFKATDFVGPLTWEALTEPVRPEASDLPWVAEAMRLLGLHERQNYGVLANFFAATRTLVDPRSTAWCGAFQHHIHVATIPGVEVPKNYLSARAWLDFGMETGPMLGATTILWRGSKTGWQGHVFTYLGESEDRIYGVGGNQSDRVSKAWFPKSRLLGYRMPHGAALTGKRIWLNSTGQPVSTNEA